MVETQGNWLPSKFKQDLIKIDPLTDKSDFDFWSKMVKKVLQQYELEDLLNRNIVLPLPGNPYYNRWRVVLQAVLT
jgi:hypothetical protein